MILLLAVMLAAAPAANGQALAGVAFEDLATRSDRSCPARRVRSITPGDLDFAQEEFEEGLSRRDRARLSSVNEADRRCADRNGLSCSTTATLEAMRKAGLMSRFVGHLCTHPDSR